nr:MAG TPA: hypothetical protein [Caudoviricetes sp.]
MLGFSPFTRILFARMMISLFLAGLIHELSTNMHLNLVESQSVCMW